MNFPVNMNLVDSWNDGFPYLSDLTWLNIHRVYINLDGNATWKSIESNTWSDLSEKNWSYQKLSWRRVI